MAAFIEAFFAGLAFADYSPRWNLEPRAASHQSVAGSFLSLLHNGIASGSPGVFPLLCRHTGIGTLRNCRDFKDPRFAVCPFITRAGAACMQVGVGMTPRGEVALIVALIGLQMNIIPRSGRMHW